MAKTNAERQAAWRVRRAQQVHATTQRLEAQLEDLKQRLAQALDENEVLRAQLAEAIAPKRARRRGDDLARFLWPSPRRPRSK
jgi:phage shock protein A